MPLIINPSGNALVDGVLWGSSWDFTNLKYAIPSAAQINTNTYGGYFQITGPVAMNVTQTAAIHRLIANLDDVCGLTITFDANAANGNIRFARVAQFDANDGRGLHTPGGGAAEAGVPTESPLNGVFFPLYAHGDIWFNKNLGAYTNPLPGTFGYAAGFMHETGHAVGLKHGHVSQVDHNVLFPALPSDVDSQEFSVMTYRRFVGDLPGGQNQTELFASDFPTTFMMADIAALQYIYGADFTSNAGNTVYRWSSTTGEMFINNVGQGAPIRNKVFLTTWDGGGIDTYDMSNYATGVNINLAPGGFSRTATTQLADLDGGPGVKFARGNVFNAMIFNNDVRSRIENANGGAGNDVIKGNTGNNVLDGRAGVDTLTGLAGDDIYIVDNPGDKVIEASGAGVDQVRASTSYTLAGVTFVEVLRTANPASINAINLTGNSQINNLTGNAGANVLNGGAAADILTGLAGNDTYVVDNAGDRINEVVAQGFDKVNTSKSYALNAGVSVEVLQTNVSTATTPMNLFGNEFANTIIGNAGANIISGQLGKDVLTGLGGNDVFVFDTTLNPVTNVDRITDYNVVADTMRLDNAIFFALTVPGTLGSDAFHIGAVAADAEDRIVFDRTTGALGYDADGIGGVNSIQFATLATTLALTAADFVVI